MILNWFAAQVKIPALLRRAAVFLLLSLTQASLARAKNKNPSPLHGKGF